MCLYICKNVLWHYLIKLNRKQNLWTYEMHSWAKKIWCISNNNKTCGHREKMLLRNNFALFLPVLRCFQKLSASGMFKDGIIWYWINPLPNKPLFLYVCSSRLLKTLWEKEKLLEHKKQFLLFPWFSTVLANSAIFIKLKIVICKLFQFGRVKKKISCLRKS